MHHRRRSNETLSSTATSTSLPLILSKLTLTHVYKKILYCTEWYVSLVIALLALGSSTAWSSSNITSYILSSNLYRIDSLTVRSLRFFVSQQNQGKKSSECRSRVCDGIIVANANLSFIFLNCNNWLRKESEGNRKQLRFEKAQGENAHQADPTTSSCQLDGRTKVVIFPVHKWTLVFNN